MRLTAFNLELINSGFPRRAAELLAWGHEDLEAGPRLQLSSNTVSALVVTTGRTIVPLSTV